LCMEREEEGWNRSSGGDKISELGRDFRFDHSWVPGGPSPGPYWIPKGRLTLDVRYPARPLDRFRYNIRKVRVLPPPQNLVASFAQATSGVMDPLRQKGKRRQEEWMEEDDLLGGELGERDLRYQLQRTGGRGEGVPDRSGHKDRRIESYGRQEGHQGDWERERFRENRLAGMGRGDMTRSNVQQGSWGAHPQPIWNKPQLNRNQNQHGSWNRGERWSNPE
jgi:hypothetical protein